MKRPGILKGCTLLLVLTTALLISLTGYSQERKLPDGSIVYSDGTRRLPNGTVIYKDGSVANNGTGGSVINLPNGTVLYPDGQARYPDNGRQNHRRKAGWLPPGQAKKIYGGSAKDYAPGQQTKWKGKGKGRKK
jgi:hypothetical protein